MIDSVDVKQAKSHGSCVCNRSGSEGERRGRQRERTEVTLRNNLSIFIFL